MSSSYCLHCCICQMCEFLRRHGTVKVYDEDAAVPYTYNGDQWISYDDVNSITLKVKILSLVE